MTETLCYPNHVEPCPRLLAMQAERDALRALLKEVVDCYDIDPTLRATINASIHAKRTP